jgi:hypothetical protein
MGTQYSKHYAHDMPALMLHKSMQLKNSLFIYPLGPNNVLSTRRAIDGRPDTVQPLGHSRTVKIVP